MIILGIICFSFQILVVSKVEPIWESMADPMDYHYQSNKELWSIDFFSPVPNYFFSPRPFTTSLFLKFVDNDYYKMILFQKLLYCICVFMFSIIFISNLNTYFTKIVSFYLLLFFFSWYNIVGWTNNVLSEPNSNSLLFLWLGFLILFVRRNNWGVTLLFCLISVLFSFTRDSWPYIIIITVFVITVYNFFKNKLDLKKSLFVFIFSITLFFVQSKTAEIGQRYKLPVFNSIVGRISKSDEYLKWFESKGMPMSNIIKEDFKNVDVDNKNQRSIIYAKYRDSTYLPLMSWALKEGKSTYQLFLLTHPSYFFLSDQTKNEQSRIFCYNFYDYFKPNLKDTDLSHSTFPLWNFPTTILLVIILLILSIYLKNILYSFPILIAILFFINALIIYNADTMEVNRHLYITQIIIQFLNIVCFSLLLNVFTNLIKRKIYGI